jgi:hypothetical protein
MNSAWSPAGVDPIRFHADFKLHWVEQSVIASSCDLAIDNAGEEAYEPKAVTYSEGVADRFYADQRYPNLGNIDQTIHKKGVQGG